MVMRFPPAGLLRGSDGASVSANALGDSPGATVSECLLTGLLDGSDGAMVSSVVLTSPGGAEGDDAGRLPGPLGVAGAAECDGARVSAVRSISGAGGAWDRE